MGRRAGWVLKQADTVVALGIVITTGVLGLLQVTPQSVTTSAILLTLGVLAAATIRDRIRRTDAEAAVAEGLQGLTQEVRGLVQTVGPLAPVAEILPSTQRALHEFMAIQTISGPEVRRAHAQARSETDRWNFKGGTGTYTRAVTLPELYRLARKGRRALVVQMEILNPGNPAVCERYARFRRSVSDDPDGTGERWSAQRVHAESYASVLAGYWYREHSGLVDVQIGLSDNISTFRYDMSETALIITQDDAHLPAVLIRRSSRLYESFATELKTSFDQSHRVPLEKVSGLTMSEHPRPDEVLSLFASLGIPYLLSDSEVPAIVEKALHARNPYA